MPTELIRRYFHEASMDALLILSGMRKAEKMVVASTAIHIKPRLFAESVTSMAATNRLMKI